MPAPADALRTLVAAELRQDVPAAVAAMVAEIRRRRPRGIAAILYYGSCLRRGLPTEGVLDFYVLVDDYRQVYRRALGAWANAILPPNVFYAECGWSGGTLRAKYAVISLRQFAAGTLRHSLQSSLWARFSQPSRLVAARDAQAAGAVEAALAEAVVAMVGAAVPLLPERFTAAELWQAAFQATYRAELRTEGPARAAELYAADRARYDALTPLALAAAGIAVQQTAPGAPLAVALSPAARRRGRWLWRLRRPLGKLLNLLRLIKGGITFSGGLDYVLWKIERHSGVHVIPSAWQRRHPLLAAPVLAWQLYRRGGFR
jgi:hypothetical protein